MPRVTTTSVSGRESAFRAQPEIDYRIEGRILRTTATGPFTKELFTAIPSVIGELIAKLAQQGKWGQIVTFQHSAHGSAHAMEEFAAYLKSRYSNPDTNPVTALLFGREVDGAELMAPKFYACYKDAGVECRICEDYSTALYWVESKIKQSSKLLAWSDSYRVGDRLIDEQHQEIFMRAADVIAATTRDVQTMCSMRLSQYARTHFSHEESLMRRINYPDIDEHVSQHDELTSKLHEISQKIAKDNLIKAELEDFISHWFLTHIAVVDVKLATYLKAVAGV